MSNSTDSVLTYRSDLKIGLRRQWIREIKKYGDKELLGKFLDSSLCNRMPTTGAELREDWLAIYVNGWIQKPSRYLWEMMRFNSVGGIYLPTDQYEGEGIAQKRGAIIMDRLLTSEENYPLAGVKEIAKAVHEDTARLASHEISNNLIYTLLTNKATKGECVVVEYMADNDIIMGYRVNPLNYKLYPDVVSVLEPVGRRDESFMWLVLLDDASISYQGRTYYDGAAISALRELISAGINPSDYVELRKKEFNTIESMIEVSSNHIDSHLLDSLLTGSGIQSFTAQEETLEYLKRHGFKQKF